MIIIAVNPKDYFQEYRNRHWNKKHKGTKKNAGGMFFEVYASQIMLFDQHETTNKTYQKMLQKRLQKKNGAMRINSISKCQFTSLNDKKYYLSDGIVSFPLSHPYLDEIRSSKKDSKEKLLKLVRYKQFEILRIEANAATACKRLLILRSILLQPFDYFKFEPNKRLPCNKFHNIDYINTKN